MPPAAILSKKKVPYRSEMARNAIKFRMDLNFGHPKWPINLKWPEMRSKVIFRHPKWPPEKFLNSVSI